MKTDPPRPLVVYTHGGGRLGNQIIRWSHWLAWAWDYPDQAEVINAAFWPYAYCFSGSYPHPGCAEPSPRAMADIFARARRMFSVSASRRLERRILPWSHRIACLSRGVQSVALNDPRGDAIDLDGDSMFARICNHRVTMCSGWKIAGWGRWKTHQERLRAYFQPVNSHSARARKLLSELRANADVVIGVLIRQTDYRDWQDGRFYYSTEDYAGWMRQVTELYPGRRASFLVACDERQDPALFEGLSFRFASGAVNMGGNAFQSFVELSLCDAILGPPSTFAATAAFVGGRPIWPLMKRGQCLHPEDVITDSLLEAAQHPIYSLAVK